MKRLLSVATLALASTQFYAQRSEIETHDHSLFYKARSLYNSTLYAASEHYFDEVVKKHNKNQELKELSSYYQIRAAILANHRGTNTLVEQYLEDFPNATNTSGMQLEIADYYFKTQKFGLANRWYDKIEVSGLDPLQKEQYLFNRGYTEYRQKNFQKAQYYLKQVANSSSYGEKASYYLGFMAYNNNDYKEADNYFGSTKENKKYAKTVSYVQSDMNFKSGNFKKAIESAKEQLKNGRSRNKSQLNKIIGESYFNLNEYQQAIPYLKAYQGERGRWKHNDYYQLGYAYFKTQDYKNAVSEFNKIISGKDAIAQNGYYHLAAAYLRLNQKQEALNAFRNASEMSFDKDIQKDAFYNYAKLSFDIGNSYESVSDALAHFTEKYPKSKESKEIKNLLLSAYIEGHDYDKALEILQESDVYEDQEMIQKVNFYKGLTFYKKELYDNASVTFDKVVDLGLNPEISAKAIYWKAETTFQQKRYDESTHYFDLFAQNPAAANTKEYIDFPFHRAFAYLKARDYNTAAQGFKEFIASVSNENPLHYTAYSRMADSYYMGRSYNQAIDAYDYLTTLANNSSKKRRTDYAQYKKAMCYGFTGDQHRKTSELESFLNIHSISSYKDDVLYQLGATYTDMGQPQKGLQAYQRLIDEEKDSPLVPKVLVKQGLIHYNNSEDEKALSKFKEVVSHFPNSDQAKEAINSSKMIYIDQGRPEEFQRWAKTVNSVDNLSDEEFEYTLFEAAERPYIDGRFEQSIKGFEKYLKNFPNGIHALKSHFYLAKSYISIGKERNALPHFEYVISQPSNEFTERSLVRVVTAYLENREYQRSIPLLEQLQEISKDDQNYQFAQSNLMKAYYETKAYQKTIQYADKVLLRNTLSPVLSMDAQLFKARSAYKSNNYALSKRAYELIKPRVTGLEGAETYYYLAFFENQNKQYKNSNQIIQKLAKKYPGFREYGGKGLLLMAANFDALGDEYQASYILENVIKRFGSYPSIINKAKAQLAKVKQKASQTNASLQP